MRDILNLNSFNREQGNCTVISYDSLPEYDREDYDLNDPKDFERYVVDVKRDARTSFEYSHYMAFLKENFDMNKCSFMENITSLNSRRIKIEIHHDPFTIEDIIRIVIRKRLAYCENMAVEQVSKEVLYLHYNLMVGLIPLCTTVHELVGNNYIFVPTTEVFGNYKEFAQRYDDFIDPEMKAVLNRIEEATEAYSEYEDRYKDLLSRHYVYVNVGDQQIPDYTEIISMMKDKISELNNKPVVEFAPQESKLKKGLIRLTDEELNKASIM